jgi:hypothetical protein
MKRLLLVLSLVFALAGLTAPTAAATHTGQAGELPDQACDAPGNAQAHASLGEKARAHDRIPHRHPGTGCVHLQGHGEA